MPPKRQRAKGVTAPTAWAPPASKISAKPPSSPGRSGVCVVPPPPSRFGRTFLVFAPWCDQGLGVQAREYVAWLTEIGFKAVVFACQPSKPSGRRAPPRMQADPAEWAAGPAVPIEYAAASRERVSREALVAFAREHRVTDALMLEPCRRPIFVLSAALAAAGVRVYAVPNIEMVRRCELDYFRDLGFARVLCNNDYTKDVLAYFRVPDDKLVAFPFALRDTRPERAAPHRRGDPVRFLLVGGMNADRRKQATRVMQAFAEARLGGRATLTVLCQGVDVVRPPPQLQRSIQVRTGHLSYADVMREYAAHHVVLMMSRAEGIGIGFHEALRAGCGVVTLDVAMYREMVLHEKTGWLVKALGEDGVVGAKLIGNDDPIVRTYTFDPKVLAGTFRKIVADGAVGEVQLRARKAYELVYSPDRVRSTYRHALGRE